MKESFREQVYFYKTERHGMYALFLIIGVVWLAFAVYPYLVKPDPVDQKQLLALNQQWMRADSIDQAERTAAYKQRYKNKYKRSNQKSKWPKKDSGRKQWTKKKAQSFPFDPNAISSDSLQLLGFKPWIADNIVKYRSHGGVFREKEDLYRIRNIDSSRVSALLPVMTIHVSQTEQASTRQDTSSINQSQAEEIQTIDLTFLDINRADQYQWMLLPGIGETKARIIVEQRDKLGGFANKEQLLDIWGIDETLYAEIAPQLVDTSAIYRKLKVNTAPPEGLAWHKYVNFKEAKIICAYRKHHGPYQSIDDLHQIIAFSEDYVQKLAPYLDFSTE